MNNYSTILNTLYQLDEEVLENALQPVLNEYEVIESDKCSANIHSFNLNGEKQFITNNAIQLKDKITGKVYYGTSAVMGERPRFARLLAIADLILSNHLPGTLVIASLVDMIPTPCRA